jgi:transposase
MSMKSHGLEPIPEETCQLMQRVSPKGTMVSQLRDVLGPIYSDEPFAHLFAKRGRAAEAPWRLALVTVLQAIEGLTDRQAAEYVRTRIDWVYALALPLDDPGFDYSILADFRQRLLTHEAQDLLLAPILQLCRERGYIRAGGKHRTQATAVLAQVGSDVQQLLTLLQQAHTPARLMSLPLSQISGINSSTNELNDHP